MSHPPQLFESIKACLSTLKDKELNDIGNIAVRPTAAAAAVRDNFCTYFNTIGSVPWQNRMVFGGN